MRRKNKKLAVRQLLTINHVNLLVERPTISVNKMSGDDLGKLVAIAEASEEEVLPQL